MHVLSRVHLVETLFAAGKAGLPVMFRCAGQIQAKPFRGAAEQT